MQVHISIVVPVHNSEQTLNELFERLVKVFDVEQKRFEVVFVDDQSLDNSWSILKNLKQQHPNCIKLIRLAKNYGQHNATLCGLNHSSGSYIITLDDDLQNPPEEIPKLIKQMERSNADLVYGVSDSKHPPLRNAGSKLWKYTAKKFDNGMGDGSSFRLIKRSLVDNIINHKQFFVFIDELLPWYTSAIEFVKVDHHPRKKGKTGYSTKKLFDLTGSLTIFYGSWPLRMMTYMGVFFSLLFFIIGLYFIFRKIFLDVAIQGFTALIVAVLFSTSLILLCFGIIGQYLINAYTVLNQKPVYSVKEMDL